MIAVTPAGERRWCSQDDLNQPSDKRTYWVIRDLTERERVSLEDAVLIKHDDSMGMTSTGMGTRVYLTLKAGLVGIADGSVFPDAAGEPVLFEKDPDGRVSDDFLRRIPTLYKQEMFLAITSGAMLEDEEKEG